MRSFPGAHIFLAPTVNRSQAAVVAKQWSAATTSGGKLGSTFRLPSCCTQFLFNIQLLEAPFALLSAASRQSCVRWVESKTI